MANMKIFGNYIREARRANGMTIKALAEESGMCESNIFKIEMGKYPEGISLENAIALGRVLGCSIQAISKIHEESMK